MIYLKNKAIRIVVIVSLISWVFELNAQDTFSIVAIDSVTREVGSAGASCVDLFQFPTVFQADFLSNLVPGEGAINTQAHWNPTNQANALNLFQQGNTPQQVINWLVSNDVTNDSTVRQYGIIRMNNGNVEGAAHTGSNAPLPRGHIIGADYVVVANFMSSGSMADSMAVAFENANGDLACRLMAAMQAGKRQGGDNRCTPSGISSLFSFVKTTTANAQIGSPTFLLSVRTELGDNIDAVDSLQVLFDQNINCSTVSKLEVAEKEQLVEVFPTRTNSSIYVKFAKVSNDPIDFQIINEIGQSLKKFTLSQSQYIDIDSLSPGHYYLVSMKFGIQEKIIISN